MSTDPDQPTIPLPAPQMQPQDRGQLTERWGGTGAQRIDDDDDGAWVLAQALNGRPLEGPATRTRLAIEQLRQRLGLPEA